YCTPFIRILNHTDIHYICNSCPHSPGHTCQRHSFPTRRSSDLSGAREDRFKQIVAQQRLFGNASVEGPLKSINFVQALARVNALDRKSTRLNSSHGSISYAVFCLKKKKAYSE